MLYKIIIYIIGLTFSYFISGTTYSDALAIEHDNLASSTVLDNYYKEFNNTIVTRNSSTAKPISDKELELLILNPKKQELLSSYYSEFLRE